MTKKKELFKPLKNKQVRLFVCGVTVYDYTHLGHARTYSFYDTLVRFLRYSGYKVTYLQNVTDVGHLTIDTGEDKVEKRAREERKHPLEIAKFYLEKHLEASDRLKLLRPDILAKATDHIKEIIDQVQTIIKNGYAYVANGSVYFDTSKFKDYGKLSKKVPGNLKAGARVEINPDKTDPNDFVLWINATKGHILGWSSPWSEWGYPGWHIEDTSIALKYFSSQYDIHGGAIELAFPHHEAEIAQAETTTLVKPYVKYWVHTGLLTINKQKMAKSLGNFIRVIDALEKHAPETLRLWIASTHYRKPLDYNEKDLKVAKKKVEKIRTTLESIKENQKKGDKRNNFSNRLMKLRKEFLKAMEDDLNTPLASTKFLEMISLVNKQIDRNKFSAGDLKLAEKTIREFGDLFQIISLPEKKELPKEALDIIKKREAARKIGNFTKADEIRNELKEKFGIILEDTKEGVKWKFVE
ncbi:MAG: cysteine--tRNA ligase [Candidatus Levybacteria bacterium]|nr:cysteine--tRNA ligase [Candidatus Levybacteria bacterium]